VKKKRTPTTSSSSPYIWNIFWKVKSISIN
jgi:hypothetical protein